MENNVKGKKMVYLEDGKCFNLNECKIVFGLKFDTLGRRDYSDNLLLTPSGSFLTCTNQNHESFTDFKVINVHNARKWIKDHKLPFNGIPAEMLEKLKFEEI